MAKATQTVTKTKQRVKKSTTPKVKVKKSVENKEPHRA